MRVFAAFVAILALASVVSASKVHVLTTANFDKFVDEHANGALIEFYAPWCGHCKSLAPHYDAAAKELGTDGFLAKVDCTTEQQLCGKHGVRGYPTLKWFAHGSVMDYEKGRTSKDIVSFVKQMGQPAVTALTSVEEATQFIASAAAPVIIVALFNGEEGRQAFDALAAKERLNDFSFAASSDAAVASHFGITSFPALVLAKQGEEERVSYTGEFTAEALATFLKAESFPLMSELGPENYRKFVDRALPFLYFFVDHKDADSKNLLAAAKQAAASFKGKLSFVSIDGVAYERHGQSLGLKQTAPGVILHNMKENGKYIFDGASTSTTAEEILAWLAQYEAGTLSAFLKSQPVPAQQTEAVYTLVGTTFKEIVNDASKDVLVEFYAPWCGHCKELKPKYEQLAEQFKGDSGVLIAAVDATENDIAGIEIEGFPTLLLFPSNDKANPISYEGARTTAAIASWINEKRTTTAGAAAASTETASDKKDEL